MMAEAAGRCFSETDKAAAFLQAVLAPQGILFRAQGPQVQIRLEVFRAKEVGRHLSNCRFVPAH